MVDGLRRRVRMSTAIIAAAVAVVLGVPPVAPLAAAPPADSPAGPEDASRPAGELVDRRTARSKTVRNADGSLTTSLYAGAVHHRQRGRWVPIDNGLARDDRALWRPASSPLDVSFKDSLASNFMRFSAAGERFAVTLEGAAAAPAYRGSAPLTPVSQVRADGAADSDGAVGAAPKTSRLIGAVPEQPSEAAANGATDVLAEGASEGASEGATEGQSEGTTEAQSEGVTGASEGVTEAPAEELAQSPTEDASGAAASSPGGPEETPATQTRDAVVMPGAGSSGGLASPEPPADRVRKGPDSRLVYDEVFPGVDVQYDVGASTVKETLVLHNADVPTTYRFKVDTGAEGLRAERLAGGGWAVYTDASPSPTWMFEAPFAVEAGDRSIPEPGGGHAELHVRTTADGLVVELAIDEAWLAAKNRQFPVLVDPTMMIQPTDEDVSFNANCGSCAPYINQSLFIGTSDTTAWRAALKFDLADIPVSADVSDAKLKTYWYTSSCITVSAGYCGGNEHIIDSHLMTAPWTATSTTSQVQFEAAASSSLTVPYNSSMDWLPLTVTGNVRDWLSGAKPNYGFYLKRRTEPLGASGPVVRGRRSSDATVMPKLEVTYVDDSVHLYEPETVRSHGALLRWSKYTGLTGAPFDRYEVHRSAATSYAPSQDTLVATLRDINTTTWQDTTAAPSASFTYKVVANTSPSNKRRVTLPADGRARTILQPEAGEGKDTTLRSYQTNTCGGGASETLNVRRSSSGIERAFVAFPLGDIPSGAAVTSASLSLHRAITNGTVSGIVAHRVTRAWGEGNWPVSCDPAGASWPHAQSGVNWTSAGGDFDGSTSIAVQPAATGSVWDSFDLTELTGRWVGGSAPNHGVILKYGDESTSRSMAYYSDNNTYGTWISPKLTVEYEDGSRANAPDVSVVEPAPDAAVRGTVVVKARASDNRRVEQVEVFAGSTALGIDTAAPYEVAWATGSSANGAYTLTAKATDDAGNVTTSAPVQVTVANSSPPTTSLSAPAVGATVTGTTTFSANASDDIAVDRVEFFANDVRIGLPDTTSPYSVSWNTLDAAQPSYDGSYILKSNAYDSHGQLTTSATRTVTVANTAGTVHRAIITAKTATPEAMTYDPAKTTQDGHGISLTIQNNSTTSWTNPDYALRYRWVGANNSVVTSSGYWTLPTLAAGATYNITPIVRPPTLPAGVDKAQYTLRWDIFHKPTSVWFAAKGNPPLDNPVVINKAIEATALGLEHYYHYEGEPVGAGMNHLTNVASGNTLLRWTPFSAPGRGLSTVVNLTYNSLEDRTDSHVGDNFSLAISGLTRLGLPLDVHPNKADELMGRSNKYIEFTDGDGTTHRFVGNAGGGWDEPPGVHLYLREHSTTDTARKWALTRPDRVTFFYDTLGYPTFVRDANGNEIKFTLADVGPGDDPGGVKRRVTKVTDAAGLGTGAAPNRSFDITYYTKTDAPKPRVRGKVKSITDHTGSALLFDYYDDGNLLRLTQRGGTTPEGLATADRSFVFTYTTSDGSAAAIATAANRVNPDPKTANQSARLFSVRDPRGKETTFTYYGPTSGQLRWKLASRTNRDGKTTDFGYDLTTRTTTVTAPLSRVSKYGYDTAGKVTAITNPKNEVTNLEWTADRHVAKVTEPTGKFTEYAYNDNGYLTDTWDQLRNHTKLTYENLPVDGGDVSTKWKAGRTVPHLSQVKTKTNPRGNAAGAPAGSYQWVFDYDANGNLTKVTEPEPERDGAAKYTTVHTYNTSNGNLESTKDANGNFTYFENYDANGSPGKVRETVDATTFRVTQFGYDDDGLLRWTQDPNHASYLGGPPTTYRSYFYYDAFHRLRRTSGPQSTADGAPLVWTAGDYDANDNVIAQFAPEFGHGFAAGPKTAMTYDVMDRLESSTNPDNETTRHGYDAAGRANSVTSPEGVKTADPTNDHAVFYGYDLLDRVVTQTRYDTAQNPAQELVTTYCYNAAGDVGSVTKPKGGSTVDCAAPPSFTTKYTYDDAHRLKAQTDAKNNTTTYDYDRDGNITQVTDANGVPIKRDYDQRGMLKQVTEKLTASRTLHTLYRYDGVGNLTQSISPRAFDASSDSRKLDDPLTLKFEPDDVDFTQFVTKHTYDGVRQLTKVDLPWQTGDQQAFIHRRYDANGNMATTTLPHTSTTLEPVGGVGGVPQSHRVVSSYFDTGWVRTTNDHVNPKATYGYNARGQQTSRTAGNATAETWRYEPDGMLDVRTDRIKKGANGDFNGGGSSSYEYDDNNQLVEAAEGTGRRTPTQEKQTVITVAYDKLGRVAQTRHSREGDTTFKVTKFGYDLNSNTTSREDDAEEGAQNKPGTSHTYSYDAADWLTRQDSDLKDGCQRIINTFTPLGRENTREIRRSSVDCASAPALPPVKQSTRWSYYDNGRLKTLNTFKGALDDTTQLIESHDVDYLETVGGATRYANGHRTKDVFTLKGPDSTGGCPTSCTATYTYDGRDRLTNESRTGTGGGSISYTLNSAGSVETKTESGKTTTMTYDGTQLRTVSVTAGTTTVSQRHLYDDEGNLDCVIDGTTGTTCPATAAAGLRQDYEYDYLNRLSRHATYDGAGEVSNASYEYDPLDRITNEVEKHKATPQRTTDFTYLGLSKQVSQETQTGDTARDATKAYTYDVYGHRISMTSTKASAPNSPQTLTYGYDVHGSVSTVTAQDGAAAGQVKATYGYDAYGNEDRGLTTDTEEVTPPNDTTQPNTNPLNSYRYTAKRFDTGSRTLDMGARRFGPATGGFTQPDRYRGALSNLGLSTDVLTGNRHSLAGGNPLSFIEWDGHAVVADGGGGGSSSPAPSGDGSDSDGGGGLLSGIREGLEDVVGFTKGAAEGGVDMAKSLWEIPKGAYSCVRDLDGCGENVSGFVSAVQDDPGGVASQMWNSITQPIVDDWQNGNKTEAVGRVGFEVISSVVAIGKVGKAGTAARAATSTARAADKAPGGGTLRGIAGMSCNVNSFAAATLVLMADGTTKRIADIKVGDLVMASDPITGERGARRVTDTIIGNGLKRLVDIEVDGNVITATAGHPFWVEGEGRWIDAEALKPGDKLLLDSGETVTVDAIRERSEVRRVHNLTVDGIHTYYVLAGSDPVLVHNCRRRPTADVAREAIENATDESDVLRCSYCGVELTTDYGSPNSLELDHVVPYSHGGGRSIDNIVAACRTCNRSKSNTPLLDWLDP